MQDYLTFETIAKISTYIQNNINLNPRILLSQIHRFNISDTMLHSEVLIDPTKNPADINLYNSNSTQQNINFIYIHSNYPIVINFTYLDATSNTDIQTKIITSIFSYYNNIDTISNLTVSLPDINTLYNPDNNITRINYILGKF